MTKTWDQLDREAFHVRQQSVLPFLQSVDHIIEIGPGKNPFSKFVASKRITLIEPQETQSEPWANCNEVTHIQKSFENVSLDDLRIRTSESVALVCFGVDFDMMQTPWVMHLWNSSKVAIFETITDLPKHVSYLESFKRCRVPTYEQDFNITFREKLSENSWPPRTHRKILIQKNDTRSFVP